MRLNPRLHIAFPGWTLFCLLLAFSRLPFPTVHAAEPGRKITSCLEVITLTPDEARKGRPVLLKGVVTCYVPGSGLLFVQDKTGGVYAFPAGWPKELNFGDIVEVQGTTDMGRFSPILNSASVVRTGERGTPSVQHIALEQLNTGRFDSQWVQVEGTVQSATFRNSICTLKVWTGGSSATVLLFGADPSRTNLVDAAIRVTGVAGTFYDEGRLSGFGLFSTLPEHLQVITAPPPSFECPLRPVRSPVGFSRDGALDHRVRLRGVVTVALPGEAFFLREESESIRVVPGAHASSSVHSGDHVEVSGFIRDFTSIPYLAEALIKKVGSSPIGIPAVTRLKDLVSNLPSGQFVSTEGTVHSVRREDNGFTFLTIEADSRALAALAKDQPFSEVLPGSRVRLAGAWSLPPPQVRNQLGPVLWLDSAASVAVLAAPRRSLIPQTGVVWKAGLGVAAAALFVALLFIARYRHRVSSFAAEKETQAARALESERELQRVTEARERLGRDLHDRIIQSIYAIGLNIDDCAQSVRAEPTKIEGRLKAALGDVNAVIGELRNVIHGLETNAIQPAEFRTALKSLGVALGSSEANRIRLNIDENAVETLTPTQATELIHIAREALSNSIRHGAALTTSFSLEARADKIQFHIEDDGRGFDVPSAEGKGFGLRNMAKRAQNLGAGFTIFSEEGRGTRVVLDIPRQKPHFISK